MEFQTLEDNIACITLNRPSRLDAIDGSLIGGVEDALERPGLRRVSGGDPDRRRARKLPLGPI